MKKRLVVDAGLLLDYTKLSTEVYEHVGVPYSEVRKEPWNKWLPSYTKNYQEALLLQTARDARLAPRLFAHGQGVAEKPMLDAAYIFALSVGPVTAYSYETPDVLEAVLSRINFANIEGWSGIASDEVLKLLDEFEEPELFVATSGLTPLSIAVIERHPRVVFARNFSTAVQPQQAIDDLMASFIEGW